MLTIKNLFNLQMFIYLIGLDERRSFLARRRKKEEEEKLFLRYSIRNC